MTNVAHVAAQMLRNGRRTIAEIICSRIEYVRTDDDPLSRSRTLTTRAQQTETHIHVLAACIEFSSPALLDDYVQWIDSLPEAVSPFDCSIFVFLQELVGVVEAQFPSDLSVLVENYINRALDSLQESKPQDDFASLSHAHENLQREYLAALLATRRSEALWLVLEAVDAGIDIESIYLDVIQPSQQKLGRLWQAGEISVAQEHYCTAATQFVMSQLQPYFLTNNSAEKTLVATCVGDELHEVGLRIVADLFEVDGWNTIYLGANAPVESIVEMMVSSGAQVLAISTTMTQHLFDLAEVINAVRSHPDCQQVKVLVGGYPFNTDPFLWNRIGADAVAVDGKEAIHVANQLVKSNILSVGESQRPTTPPVFEEFNPSALSETDDDLSRLNNNLVTLQRKLNKANVQLAAANNANQDKAEALQRADRRKDEFLAMLARELRGPLAPMELAVSLLQMENLDQPVAKEARETLKRQLHQMKHLIGDLLDASRIAHGKITLEKKKLDLEIVLLRAIEIVHPLIQEKQQDFVLDLLDTPILLEGDEIRLVQVFANLLTNASKYTEEKGTLWLSTKRERDTVAIEIKDNGVGIESDLLPDVFLTFSQEQRSRRHSMGGLGLGLSLVKQLLDLHAGTVKAESDGAGTGSVFTVTLPVFEPDDRIHSHEPSAPEQSVGNAPARRVLIVEDTAGIAKITAVLFEKLGHSPEIALDGATAIQAFEQSRPEIVVLDLELPDMSGLDVSREIRRIDFSNSTLVVAVTGHGDDEHRKLAQENGCDEYLVKPVSLRDLERLATHVKLNTTNRCH